MALERDNDSSWRFAPGEARRAFTQAAAALALKDSAA